MQVYNIWSRYGGCGYVRQLLPQQANSWDGDVEVLGEQKQPSEQAKGIASADVVVFHRPDQKEKRQLAETLKKAGKKIIFDNDDTIFKDECSTMTKFMEYQDNLYGQLPLYDLITCSTEYLKTEFEKYNPNTVVLPNCVMPEDYPSQPLKNETDKVRIGIVGSVTYKDDREVLEPILKDLANRDDIQLVIFGLFKEIDTENREDFYKDDLSFWRELTNIEWVSWKPIEEYIPTLNELRLDIMIAPRKDNYFNRCKSNLKYLEASMLEIPFIGQSFEDGNSPYDKDLNGQNGILCKTLDDWNNAIELLVINKQLRQDIGLNAKKYVLENYNIWDKAYMWENAYESLFKC